MNTGYGSIEETKLHRSTQRMWVNSLDGGERLSSTCMYGDVPGYWCDIWRQKCTKGRTSLVDV